MSPSARQQVSTYDLHVCVVHTWTNSHIHTENYRDCLSMGVSLRKPRNPVEKSQHSAYMCLDIRRLNKSRNNFTSPSLISPKVGWLSVQEHLCCNPLTWEGKSTVTASDLKGHFSKAYFCLVSPRWLRVESLHQVDLKQWSQVLLNVLWNTMRGLSTNT